MFDYLIVGAGLFGSVFSYEMSRRGYKCHVIDRRNHIGGNCYSYDWNGIEVHKYGAHIFRTNDKDIWNYVNCFDEFNSFVNSPIARYKNELFNLPVNMNTFHQLWGVVTPEEARRVIESQLISKNQPRNLEEKLLSTVGADVYEKLFKEYTEKQWGKPCSELPVEIVSRIPIRMRFDNNYFNERYQGIPINGYTNLLEKLLSLSKVDLEVNYDITNERFKSNHRRIVYCGRIDELFNFKYGELPYRSLVFEEKIFDTDNYQGNAVVNYTSLDVPYTRSIEHKHFKNTESNSTIVTFEFSADIKKGKYPYYPMKSKASKELYKRYKKLADEEKITLGGNVAEYEDYTMDETIKSALNTVRKVLSQ